ncbi:MAG: hypothetical protein JST89_08390 [Cyanobacteria bacterium SZAS-4]|nr:hypothetical protein [Cyanobacteria bacterium SZAS-4]
MADVPQAMLEKAKPASGTDNDASGFNLVDLSTPAVIDKQARQPTVPRAEVVSLPIPAVETFHLTRPAPDADLNRKTTILDPSAWDNDAAIRKFYENGMLKLFADPDGKQQFGVRISDQKSDRTGIVPIRPQHFNDKGVSLELRMKF